MVILTQFFHLVGSEDRVRLMCNRAQNYATWGLIAPFLTNHIAGNNIDFKMNVIKAIIGYNMKNIINVKDV